MYESVIDHIEQLQRSVRRWRAAAILLLALLLAVITGGITLLSVTDARSRIARAEAERARAVAAEAALQAERALQIQRQNKK